MALEPERAEFFDFSGFEEFNALHDAFIFADHVFGAEVVGVVEDGLALFKHGGGDVAQGFDLREFALNDFGCALAAFAALVVVGFHEVVFDHGVCDDDLPAGGHGDGFQHFNGTEVAENEGILLSVKGAELVEEPGFESEVDIREAAGRFRRAV